MLELGWSEIFVIVALAVLLVGPKELPAVMHGIGRIARRVYYIKYAFSRQFEEFLKEADIEDLRNSVNFEVMNRNKPDFNEADADADEDYHPKPLKDDTHA